VLEAFARDRQVIAFEQQGFGHTADIADRPFSFVQSADDTAALLRHLHIGQADLFGFSNGGTMALQVAIRHPQAVRKLVAASGFFQREGSSYPWFWDGFAGATLESMPKELREAYLEVRRTLKTCRVFSTSASDACAILRTSRLTRSVASPRRRSSWWATPT
jgi:pimeloyl-ACP methyl ester carboxylesterase